MVFKKNMIYFLQRVLDCIGLLRNIKTIHIGFDHFDHAVKVSPCNLKPVQNIFFIMLYHKHFSPIPPDRIGYFWRSFSDPDHTYLNGIDNENENKYNGIL